MFDRLCGVSTIVNVGPRLGAYCKYSNESYDYFQNKTCDLFK